MKCPECGYKNDNNVERCNNCGFANLERINKLADELNLNYDDINTIIVECKENKNNTTSDIINALLETNYICNGNINEMKKLIVTKGARSIIIEADNNKIKQII